jgi:putative FmdB family regulatory protein
MPAPIIAAVPTYEYVCESCGTHVEVYQRFTDEPLTTCAVCGGKLRKVFHPAGILFKGSGFYVTDSRGKTRSGGGTKEAKQPAASTASSEGGSSSAGSGDSSSSSSSSSSKPESKSDSKSESKSESGSGSGSGSGAKKEKTA